MALYEDDEAEPLALRTMVVEAIRIAEARAEKGGDPNWDHFRVGTQFVDNYDVVAIGNSLDACCNAALNTHVDLNVFETKVILDISRVARAALFAAFPEYLEGPEPEHLAVLLSSIVFDATPMLQDYSRLRETARLEGWDDLTGVSPEVFEPVS